MKHYIAWFKKLYREYGLFVAIRCTYFNAKNFNLDGSYR